MADPNISDQERMYFVESNDEWRAQRIISMKGVWTFVREHRDAIDISIHQLIGPGPIRHDVCGEHFDNTDYDVGDGGAND